MKKFVLLLMVSTFLFSCQNETGVETKINRKEGEVRSKMSAGNQSAQELKEAAEKRQEQRKKEEEERLAKQTTMEILPAVHDFGRIPKETPVTKVFKIKNTGDKPLIINDAQASCGCTVPRKPEEPILPGEEGELEVTFKSNPGQAGTKVDKRITLTANIPGATMFCTIKADVEN